MDECVSLSRFYRRGSLKRNEISSTMLHFLLEQGVLRKNRNFYIFNDKKIVTVNILTVIKLDQTRNSITLKLTKCFLEDSNNIVIPLCNDQSSAKKVEIEDNGRAINVSSIRRGVREWVIMTSETIKGGTMVKVEAAFEINDDKLCIYCELDKKIVVKIRTNRGKKIEEYVIPDVMLEGNKSLVKEELAEEGKAKLVIKDCRRGFVYLFQ